MFFLVGRGGEEEEQRGATVLASCSGYLNNFLSAFFSGPLFFACLLPPVAGVVTMAGLFARMTPVKNLLMQVSSIHHVFFDLQLAQWSR